MQSYMGFFIGAQRLLAQPEGR